MGANEGTITAIESKKQYSEYLFIAYLSYMSLYIICISAIEHFFNENPIYKIGNYIALILAIFTLVPLIRKVPTDFLIQPLIINKKRISCALTHGLIICLVFGGAMILLKYLLLKFAPETLVRCQPFFYTARLMPGKITSNTLIYPFTAFWQEYFMNVMGYDGMRTLLVGNHKKHKAVSMVALFFGAMHFTYGFTMILLTMLFVLFMNNIYRRTHNLWVCCLVHIILGQLLFTLQLQKITISVF